MGEEAVFVPEPKETGADESIQGVGGFGGIGNSAGQLSAVLTGTVLDVRDRLGSWKLKESASVGRSKDICFLGVLVDVGAGGGGSRGNRAVGRLDRTADLRRLFEDVRSIVGRSGGGAGAARTFRRLFDMRFGGGRFHRDPRFPKRRRADTDSNR